MRKKLNIDTKLQMCFLVSHDNKEILKRFYRAMLCIRGISHGPVSVCPSVRLSVRHKSLFY